MRWFLAIWVLAVVTTVKAQHSHEFYSNGAVIHITAGAEVHVNGDVHFYNGLMTLDGLLKTQGNSYSDPDFQQRGTGTYRIQNSTVNTGEEQFISGAFNVRGFQETIGVDDGSFYNLELDNDQGIVYLVGSGWVADVRNSVNFMPGSIHNRIITHDISLFVPANGQSYSAVFGIMNSTAGLGSLLNNTITLNGNMSAIDAGYIQGKLRRAIDPDGGTYPFPVGLEPSSTDQPRGIQHSSLNLETNDYNVIQGYFQAEASNNSSDLEECGYDFIYFQGDTHGEWVYSSLTYPAGSGSYEIQVWPQGTFPSFSVWTITKDDILDGTVCDLGPGIIGLDRAGFTAMDNMESFGLVAGEITLPINLLSFEGTCDQGRVLLEWVTISEQDNDYFLLERSFDSYSYEVIDTVGGAGSSNEPIQYNYIENEAGGYFYRLSQVDFDGTRQLFESIYVPCGDVLHDFKVFPNPVSRIVNVKNARGGNLPVKITILNLQGDRLTDHAFVGDQIQIDISTLSAGIYLMKLETPVGHKLFRILKEE